jgi:hypothetical protein
VKGAALIEASGSPDEAFLLYCRAAAWAKAGGLVVAHAEQLMAQGRFRTLADWVAALPVDTVDAQPWLAYWRGRALVPIDPGEGRRYLIYAHAGFERYGETLGEVAAAASIIDSIYIENRHFVQMDPWIAVLERKLLALDWRQASGTEIAVYSSALVAMLYRQPGHRLMSRCLGRLAELLELEGDLDTRVGAGVLLLSYAGASGDFEVGHRVRVVLEPLVERQEVGPARRFLWRLWLAYFFMLTGDYAAANASYQTAEDLNEANRFPWAANLLFCRALCYCSNGEGVQAVPHPSPSTGHGVSPRRASMERHGDGSAAAGPE